ncbi:MAG TPA: quinoprotein dehydrogenase-associated putative ABC transporter substrate-binding protein [Silvibacterium sp.]|nr:quinoprotein dehydrogenase-associated putative ABC transporter substrate-binding protein [Silvibacterium sp.]
MFSRCLSFALVLLCAGAAFGAAPLRVCADPDNLPFSNRNKRGFDNRIAAMIAHDLGREPLFVWASSRRGFLREQFNKNACDVLMGTPGGMHGVLQTEPYYRSTYVFVTPAREHLQIASFDDPHLNGRRIGLQVLEEDYSPPSLPLIRRGYAAQLVGFESFGAQNGEIVQAVANRHVGVAVVWGPVAGYFAARQRVPLALTAVSPPTDSSGIPFAYSITVAVHQGDLRLRDSIDGSLTRLRPQIARIVAEYHVPVVPQQRGAQ